MKLTDLWFPKSSFLTFLNIGVRFSSPQEHPSYNLHIKYCGGLKIFVGFFSHFNVILNVSMAIYLPNNLIPNHLIPNIYLISINLK